MSNRALLLTMNVVGLLASIALPASSQQSEPTTTVDECRKLITFNFDRNGKPPYYLSAQNALKHVAPPPARCFDSTHRNSCVATVMWFAPEHAPVRWSPGDWLPPSCTSCIDPSKDGGLTDCETPGAVRTVIDELVPDG